MTRTDQPSTIGARPFLIGAAVLAAVIVAAVTVITAGQTVVGLPEADAFTEYGLPIVRALTEMAAAIAIGCLMFAAFFVPPQSNGLLDVAGYRAVRMASVAALLWALGALLLIPLTLSDVSGQPLSVAILPENLVASAGRVETTVAWIQTAVLAFVLAIAARSILRWGWTPVLFAFGLASLLPLALTGHSSAGGAHDIATNSLIIHLVAAAVWAGGLVAVLAYAVRGGTHVALAVRRFSTVAAWAVVALAASGVINALVRLPISALGSTYGALVIAKATALILVAVLGWQQRRRVVDTIEDGRVDRSTLARLAGIEVLIFGAVIGLAVGLGRTAPPESAARIPTQLETVVGYAVSGPPTFARLMLDWRFDLIYGTLAILLAVLYLIGVRRLRRRGDAWPVGRTVAWLLGCGFLLFTTSSGIGVYAPLMFSIHMISHMMLSMLVPVLLVLGGPITLALRALPPAGRGGPPGPREWILAAVHSPVSRFLTQPLVAATLFVGGFYALYLGGIFEATAGSHFAHLLMNAHFLVTGYLFYWVVIGVDPAPKQYPPVVKLAMVIGSLPFHAFFGVAMMSAGQVLAEQYYANLQLPWAIDLFEDQRVGGGIAWAAGEIPLMVVIIALMVQWVRSDERLARRIDRAADRDDEADLAAHNAMYRELARRDRESQSGR
ncbi:cytochrome c oxidase assembly protein [Millisia brevis]|uniref:cytochrome c oxidase assembly protein n=1 Tax=Millisia brevis TaxID=264148 RepID=UPI0008352550|nr:cytochrome c oxidase assembly protein [Millisia brevis]